MVDTDCISEQTLSVLVVGSHLELVNGASDEAGLDRLKSGSVSEARPGIRSLVPVHLVLCDGNVPSRLWRSQ